MSIPKILIIDDSAAMCFFMTTALQRVGYQVTVALDGHNGLAKLSMQRPDCLILDIVLPDINGYTICRQVRAVDPQHTLPIILTSTKSTPLDLSYGLRMGADRYLPKPFTEEELIQAVGSVLPQYKHTSSRTELKPSEPSTSPMQTIPMQTIPMQALEDVIPRRRKDHLIFAVSNQKAGSAMDQIMHQVFMAIDGRKTVKDLCRSTHLSEQEIMKILQKLFEQKRIDLFNREGRLLTVSPFKQPQ